MKGWMKEDRRMARVARRAARAIRWLLVIFPWDATDFSNKHAMMNCFPSTHPHSHPSSSSSSSTPIHRKLVVLGDGAVGKSSFLLVKSKGYFPTGYEPTVSVFLLSSPPFRKSCTLNKHENNTILGLRTMCVRFGSMGSA